MFVVTTDKLKELCTKIAIQNIQNPIIAINARGEKFSLDELQIPTPATVILANATNVRGGASSGNLANLIMLNSSFDAEVPCVFKQAGVLASCRSKKELSYVKGKQNIATFLLADRELRVMGGSVPDQLFQNLSEVLSKNKFQTVSEALQNPKLLAKFLKPFLVYTHRANLIDVQTVEELNA